MKSGVRVLLYERTKHINTICGRSAELFNVKRQFGSSNLQNTGNIIMNILNTQNARNFIVSHTHTQHTQNTHNTHTTHTHTQHTQNTHATHTQHTHITRTKHIHNTHSKHTHNTHTQNTYKTHTLSGSIRCIKSSEECLTTKVSNSRHSLTELRVIYTISEQWVTSFLHPPGLFLIHRKKLRNGETAQ